MKKYLISYVLANLFEIGNAQIAVHQNPDGSINMQDDGMNDEDIKLTSNNIHTEVLKEVFDSKESAREYVEKKLVPELETMATLDYKRRTPGNTDEDFNKHYRFDVKANRYGNIELVLWDTPLEQAELFARCEIIELDLDVAVKVDFTDK